jgi:predicted Zn-dependent peptidase
LTDLTTSLNNLHHVPANLKDVPAEKEFKYASFGNTVILVDHDMKQAEIVMLSEGDAYKVENLPIITMYNNYFGGGMSSVVFQDLRESKALAYSAYSSYRNPKSLKLKHNNFSYIGSQADKLAEATKGLSDLLNDMPKADGSFNAAKEAVIQDIRSERITKSDILFNYENAKKFGHTYDVRKDIFEKVQKMTFDDVKKFQESTIKNKPTNTVVLGKKEMLDMKVLEKYGKVKELSLKDVFGY